MPAADHLTAETVTGEPVTGRPTSPPLFSLAELEIAAELVHCTVPPTPQYAWPLLAKRTGCEVWVKHENHTPTCAFKVRGGIVYMDNLKRSQSAATRVISATRGNHGQSIAFSAFRAGIPATIYVPHGNSVDQNAAMRGFGATVVEYGRDFDEALAECHRVAREQGLHFIPPFNRDLAKGVATYALELFRAVADLDTVYVPIGMGSGICGLITTRDLLGLKTEIVGVVARAAPAMALSFAAGKPVPTGSAQTFADGMATRDPRPEAVAIIKRGAARILQLSEEDIAAAVRAYFQDTHNVAEGAGAAALAGLMQERARMTGKRVAVILSGGNIDASVYRRILAGETPQVG
jgi:threonine dehydratase